jgi:hypothetical protein
MVLSKIACSMLFTFLLLLWAPDLLAPEIAGRDVFGFDPYMVSEDGSVVDSEGAVRGWVHGATVYDAQWNPRYRLDGSRLCKVDEE